MNVYSRFLKQKRARKKLQESVRNAVEKLKLKIQKVQLTKWKKIQKIAENNNN